MSRVLEILRSRLSPRGAVLALMTIGLAACSADTSRSNSNPEATGSIAKTQTTTQVAQPHRSSRLRRRSSPTSTSPATARLAAAPEITGSVVRKPASSANWSWNGGTAIAVADAETVDTIARPAKTASTEPQRAAGDFAARRPNLPKTPNLDAPEPATINNSHAGEHEPMGAQEEMPLIWPVLTEAERAGLPDPARESVPGPVFLVGALAMVLLCAGAIFKLARRQTQSYHPRSARGSTPARPGPEDVGWYE
jgi:hypothetical protein